MAAEPLKHQGPSEGRPLFLSRTLPLPRQNASVITFRVDDLEQAVERLQAAGVHVLPIHRAEWGAAAHFRDPEGNELQVYEPA